MDWQDLNLHRSHRRQEFYLTALSYGNYLWLRGLTARAILCLDRAMGADLNGTEQVLEQWPIPYAAMAWFLAHTPREALVGNPRVHFQHYADRMNEPRREQRRWRAWACWAISRTVLPDLPGDPKHDVKEPSFELIGERLTEYGFAHERDLWQNIVHVL